MLRARLKGFSSSFSYLLPPRSPGAMVSADSVTLYGVKVVDCLSGIKKNTRNANQGRPVKEQCWMEGTAAPVSSLVISDGIADAQKFLHRVPVSGRCRKGESFFNEGVGVDGCAISLSAQNIYFTPRYTYLVNIALHSRQTLGRCFRRVS